MTVTGGIDLSSSRSLLAFPSAKIVLVLFMSTSPLNILVTGANKGIGLEICRQLARLGHHVILSARSPERGADAVEKLAEVL